MQSGGERSRYTSVSNSGRGVANVRGGGTAKSPRSLEKASKKRGKSKGKAKTKANKTVGGAEPRMAAGENQEPLGMTPPPATNAGGVDDASARKAAESRHGLRENRDAAVHPSMASITITAVPRK